MPTRCIRRRAGLATLLALLLVGGCAGIRPAVGPSAKAPAPAKVTAKPGEIAPATKVPPAAQALFGQARAAMAANNPKQAVALLTRFTKTWPVYASPFTDLGLAYMRLGKDDQALAALAEAVKRQPADCRAQVAMGILQRRRHAFGAAETAYNACLKVDPDNRAALLNLGILYEIYMGKLPEALAAYRHYQSLNKAPDKRVAGWIAALSRQIARTNSIADGGSAP